MDILTDYRITALLPSERELALRAERARVALERVPRHAHRRTLRQLFAGSTARVGTLTGPIATLTGPIAITE